MKIQKSKLFDYFINFILGFMAGVSISIGCVAFLASGNKIVGALFFTIGLFLVLTFKFNLFTGKVCYAFDNNLEYSLKLVFIWLGNFLGAIFVAGILGATRLASLQDACAALVNVKLNDKLISLFILGAMCNLLIFVAVHGFNNFENPIFRTLALFFGVSVFVLCGFEHCVADMFYFSFAKAWSWATIGRLLIITLGNIVGGLFIPIVTKLINYCKNQK